MFYRRMDKLLTLLGSGGSSEPETRKTKFVGGGGVLQLYNVIMVAHSVGLMPVLCHPTPVIKQSSHK